MKVFQAEVRFPASTKGKHTDVLFTNGKKPEDEGYMEYRVFATPGSAREEQLMTLKPKQQAVLCEVRIRDRESGEPTTHYDLVEFGPTLSAKLTPGGFEEAVDQYVDAYKVVKKAFTMKKIWKTDDPHLPAAIHTTLIHLKNLL